MVAQLLIGALAKAHGPGDIPPLLADDPNEPFAVNSDPFSVLNLACPSDPCHNSDARREQQRKLQRLKADGYTHSSTSETPAAGQAAIWLASSLIR